MFRLCKFINKMYILNRKIVKFISLQTNRFYFMYSIITRDTTGYTTTQSVVINKLFKQYLLPDTSVQSPNLNPFWSVTLRGPLELTEFYYLEKGFRIFLRKFSN